MVCSDLQGKLVALKARRIGVETEQGVRRDVGGIGRSDKEVLVRSEAQAVKVVAEVLAGAKQEVVGRVVCVGVEELIAGENSKVIELRKDVDDSQTELGGFEIQRPPLVDVDALLRKGIEKGALTKAGPPRSLIDCLLRAVAPIAPPTAVPTAARRVVARR